MSTDDCFFAEGGGDFCPVGFVALKFAGDDPNEILFDEGVHAWGRQFGVTAVAGQAAGPDSRPAGVRGSSADSPGVRGTSSNSFGVYGTTGDPTRLPDFLGGVYGGSLTQPGVVGYSRENDGTQGLSFTGTGVRAASFFGPGVHSISGAQSGVTGVSGTQGPPVGMNIPTTAGVVGSADAQPGLIGTSRALMGIYGFSTGNAGVVGQTANPNSFAGFFAGNVMVVGNLTVVNGTKSVAVPFPDGSRRVLYCIESPELWFEDFGAAKLKRGRAVVKLDADFVKVIRRGDYHVFLTPRGDCRGLYVRHQGGASFEVRELARGTSSIAFSYRIVGRRKDVRAQRRFAKIDTSFPGAATRPIRKPKHTEAAHRAFIARLQKEARERAPKGTGKRGRPRGVDEALRLRDLHAQAKRAAKKIGRAEGR